MGQAPQQSAAARPSSAETDTSPPSPSPSFPPSSTLPSSPSGTSSALGSRVFSNLLESRVNANITEKTSGGVRMHFPCSFTTVSTPRKRGRQDFSSSSSHCNDQRLDYKSVTAERLRSALRRAKAEDETQRFRQVRRQVAVGGGKGLPDFHRSSAASSAFRPAPSSRGAVSREQRIRLYSPSPSRFCEDESEQVAAVMRTCSCCCCSAPPAGAVSRNAHCCCSSRSPSSVAMHCDGHQGFLSSGPDCRHTTSDNFLSCPSSSEMEGESTAVSGRRRYDVEATACSYCTDRRCSSPKLCVSHHCPFGSNAPLSCSEGTSRVTPSSLSGPPFRHHCPMISHQRQQQREQVNLLHQQSGVQRVSDHDMDQYEMICVASSSGQTPAASGAVCRRAGFQRSATGRSPGEAFSIACGVSGAGSRCSMKQFQESKKPSHFSSSSGFDCAVSNRRPPTSDSVLQAIAASLSEELHRPVEVELRSSSSMRESHPSLCVGTTSGSTVRPRSSAATVSRTLQNVRGVNTRSPKEFSNSLVVSLKLPPTSPW